MSKKQDEIFIKKLKAELDNIPERDNEKITAGKARFLAQAKLIQRSPVSVEVPERHNKWSPNGRKEKKMSAITTILAICIMVFGGLTGTVAASQNDLPGEPLYRVKLITEQTRIGLTLDPQKKIDLELKFAAQRFAEIQELKEAGIEPPYASYARLENHIADAFDEAAKLEEPLLTRTLLRIRDRLQTCLDQVDPNNEPLQTRLRTMLQERINWLDEGIEEPERFLNQAHSGWEKTATFEEENQYQYQNQEQYRYEETKEPGSGNQTEEPGNNQTPAPGYQTPGPGYQTPGPGNSTPGSGYQTPGPGYQTPGSGKGN
jgi:hypothetical protein